MLFIEWSLTEVKEWALTTFKSKRIANNFEEEEIDGKILLSSTVQTTVGMEKLRLTTIGKKEKFLQTIQQLRQAYMHNLITMNTLHENSATFYPKNDRDRVQI